LGRPALLVAVAVLALISVVAARTAAGARAGQKITIFSLAQEEQFVNNADDRARGKGNNPFGKFNDVAPSSDKATSGPFPGDEALFKFDLYSAANLKTRIGSATFTCQYNFAKNAFCDAIFRMTGGDSVIAAGQFNFNATKFTLAVTGGSGRYSNKRGVLEETPSANHAQRLTFEFT
jgi:type II secretory pathway pseudopilin PulG